MCSVRFSSWLVHDYHLHNSITNKANQSLGFLKRNLKIKSSHVKSHAYKALVRPKLEYASAVRDPHTRTQINQIEKAQRRATRYVTNRYHNTSSVTDATKFKLAILRNQENPSQTHIMFYNIIHHVVAIHPLDTLLLPTTTITRYNTSHTYKHIRTDKDSYKYSFYPRTIIQWNLLPNHIHEAATVDAFKALIPVTVLASYLAMFKRSPNVYSSTLALNYNEHRLYIRSWGSLAQFLQNHCTP